MIKKLQKYSDKFKDLSKVQQDLIIKKIKTVAVEVIISENTTTLIIPQSCVSYNQNMRSPSFEKQMLDFKEEMLEFKEEMLEFKKFVLEFVKRQEAWNKRVEARLDEHDAIFKRNNLK